LLSCIKRYFLKSIFRLEAQNKRHKTVEKPSLVMAFLHLLIGWKPTVKRDGGRPGDSLCDFMPRVYMQ
jgi:hypothetical protein